uniref:NADH dehydrogenase subunit 2 n=1 Tax=Praya dubia TaxID=316184 RepID=UPI0026E4396F|nr:NADH dehydrogenase subunit 2 [Praya dubia]WJJ70090.1 NADH dehydrogenase subunit 2 [Praya dubia]
MFQFKRLNILIFFFLLLLVLKNVNFNWKNFILIFMFIIFLILNNIYKEFDFEDWILSLIVFIGSFVIITYDHFLIIYLGLEIQTFSFLILISKNKKWINSSEAGLKYFMLGALSSGLFLFGVVLLFITNFSLTIQDFLLHNNPLSSLLISLSFFFKLSLFPFHFWVPDIYEGSSLKVLGLIGSLPKISVIYVLIQFKVSWLFLMCSLLSIIVGTLGALNQTKIKRLVAYSGISNIGFIVLGLTLINQKSYLINNIYLVLYIIGFISFIILISKISLSKNNYIIELSDNQFINILFSLSWIIILFSIAGIPPFSGFISKWLLIWNILEENYIISSLICIVFSALGVVYYIKIIKIIFFQKNSSYIIWKKIILYDKINVLNYYILGSLLFIIIFLVFNCKFLLLFFNFNFILIN